MANSGRVFPRGMTSENCGLGECRAAQLAAPWAGDNAVVADDAKAGHHYDVAAVATA